MRSFKIHRTLREAVNSNFPQVCTDWNDGLIANSLFCPGAAKWEKSPFCWLFVTARRIPNLSRATFPSSQHSSHDLWLFIACVCDVLLQFETMDFSDFAIQCPLPTGLSNTSRTSTLTPIRWVRSFLAVGEDTQTDGFFLSFYIVKITQALWRNNHVLSFAALDLNIIWPNFSRKERRTSSL